MRFLSVLLAGAAVALATPINSSITDLDNALASRIAATADSKEAKALQSAKTAVDAYLAAANPDKKARGYLPKAAKAITKSLTPDSTIAADGQVAIQDELGSIAEQFRADAEGKMSLKEIKDTITATKMAALLAKGDAIWATLATITDFAKADTTANKAIANYEKAVALADAVLP